MRTAEALRRERMEITLPTLIDLFIAAKSTEGRSRRTQEWYREQLGRFTEFVTEDVPVRMKDVSIEDARAFISSLQSAQTKYQNHPLRPVEQDSLAPQTVHGYVRAMRSFSHWLLEEGYTSIDVFARLKRPKLPKTMIEILSDDEVGRILQSVNPATFLGARLYAVALVLYDTGMRAMELCNLTLADVYLDEGQLKVKGKGNKERLVPISPATKGALLRYMGTFRQGDDEHLFLSTSGDPLTYAGLAHIVKRLGKKAGVPRLHCHLIRHSFAVKYLTLGGDLMSLKMILGHTDIQTTQVYLHLADSHIKAKHDRFSPVASLKLKKRRVA